MSSCAQPPCNPLEIEVKFHVAEVDSTRNLIVALGATPCGRVFETNTRFENRAKSLKDEGILLRLRKDDRIRLTFKSLPAVLDKDFKMHHELEVQVDNFDTCGAILEGLGFHQEQTYEKWRDTLTLRDTKLLIDTMPYGVFLEIEGKKSDIRNIADQLHLTWKERIVLNYLEMFEIIRREEGLPFTDVTFDNFERTRVDIRRYLPLLYAG